jgi:hypothetical protein
MAIMTNPADFAAPVIKLGPKAAMAVLYVAIGAVAIAVAVPLALATGDAALFEECYSACTAASQLAAQ